MPPKMTHICLHVKELDVCVRFYQRYCNMDVNHERTEGGEGSVYMSEAGRQTEIVFQFKSGGDNLPLADDDERRSCLSSFSKSSCCSLAYSPCSMRSSGAIPSTFAKLLRIA